ncbi:MAG TPA: S41 family peptidase [Pyrinomonadaceae bacterium]|nr:S41 family peptidase [Chloracidobacterium sp.]MBP9934674.1 S41 family peptidase [Pyrinomonadaceae bacterium]MBK7804620.1 S41 family peptidase [Chloracidobacterium sp.]MBL0240540.1 S41 family peptidase [Chloracidobacterium sp.]HQX56807.1 S41 family peptidase [Pyrinomonadaceae bacterium]
MDKKFPLIAVILIVAGSIIGGLLGRMPSITSADSAITPERITSEYSEAFDVVNSNFAGKIDSDKISDGAIQGMLWTLDPHSSYFTRDEFRKLSEEQSSQFYGIGVSILQHRDGVYVQSVVPGTPAEKAGLRYGDRFVSVEGKDAKEWSSGEVSKNVRGEKGTPVKIRIERVSSANPIDLEIVRGGVPLPSIRNYFMLPDSVGYVGLTGGFQETTAEELKQSIAELKKQGMKSLILDLRGNPGGILEQAVQVVSKFVPSGKTVVSVKAARGAATRELKTYDVGYETLPLVVMINGGSASAAEIVAGAVQDYGRGLVIGSDSFGKGLVQRVFRLPFGTGLTLTTARYYTPYGRSLQRDYSSGSIYDYYTHLADSPDQDQSDVAPKPAGSPVNMPDGRVLYGGRGIEPDVRIPAAIGNPLKARINEAAFFFVRQLVAGKISGLETYRTERQNFRANVAAGEFAVNDRLLDAFRGFTSNEKANGLTSENLNSQLDYCRTRIREELATANYSTEAGVQVLLETDPQILKAIESMSQAAKLTETASVMRS